MSVLVLDVGCGSNKYQEDNAVVYGIDKYKTPDVDKLWDGETESIPYPDNYFDKIVSRASLQEFFHVSKIMEEMWRVGKSDAKVLITVPYYRSCNAFFERNKSFFRLDSFGYECVEDDYGRWTTKVRFKRIKNNFQMITNDKSIFRFLRVLNPMINLPYFKYFFRKFLAHIIIPEGLEFELVVIKEKGD